MKIKVVEFFSGIGSQAKALSRISRKRKIEIDVLKTCEWNIHAFVAYNLIHSSKLIPKNILHMTKEELVDELDSLAISYNGKNSISRRQLLSLNDDLLKLIYHSIINNNNLVNIEKVKGVDLPNDIDLLTYSFPCQDLSNVGSFHGYKHGIDRDKNTRSGLLWEVERILEEKKRENDKLPKFLLLENVTALVAQRHNVNFEEWKMKLELLGYKNRVYTLNAQDFGIPQYRKRIIMLSILVGNDSALGDKIEKYLNQHNLNDINYLKSLKIPKRELKNFLRLNYEEKNLYKEALEAQPNLTKSRLKIWDSNSKIVDEQKNIAEKVQTITTKQDRHPNSGNIFFNPDNDKSKFRFLTPRECFLLMGFDEKDYDKLLINNIITRRNSLLFTRDILYKLAGNSIVVDILEHVFDQLIDIKQIYIDK